MAVNLHISKKILTIGVALFVVFIGLIFYNTTKSSNEVTVAPQTLTIAPDDTNFSPDQNIVTGNQLEPPPEFKSLVALEVVAKELLPLAFNANNKDDFDQYIQQLDDTGYAGANSYIYGPEFFNQCVIDNCKYTLLAMKKVPRPTNAIPDKAKSEGEGVWFEVTLKIVTDRETRETANSWYLFRGNGEAEVSIEPVNIRLEPNDGVPDGQDSAGDSGGTTLDDGSNFTPPGFLDQPSP